MTLLARLLILLTVALLPVLGVRALDEIAARSAREPLGREEALRIAHLVAQQQERIVEGVRSLLGALGTAPPLASGDPTGCAAYFEAAQHRLPRHATIEAADLSGRVVCSGRTSGIGTDIGHFDWFYDALRHEDAAISSFAVDPGSSKPSITIAQRFHYRDGAAAGVVAAALDLEWLAWNLEQILLPPGSAVTILDRHGDVLARRPANGAPLGTPARDQAGDLLRAVHDGAAVSRLANNIVNVLVHVPAPGRMTGLFVMVELDASVAFRRIEHANTQGLLLISATVLIAFGLLALGAQHVIRKPSGALLEGALRWRRGEWSARVSPVLAGSASEFVTLGRAFDEMAQALAARERDLAASARWLRLATEGAGVGIWEHDLVTGRGTWSQEAVALLGVQRASFTTLDWSNAVHPDDRAGALSAWTAALKGGTPYEIEYRTATPDQDGQDRWVLARGRVERDRTGRPIRGVGVLIDVTARRQVETALAGSEARLRLAMQTVRVGVWEVDLRNGCWRLDQAAIEITGARLAADRWIEMGTPEAREWYESIHEDDAPIRAAAYARVRSGETQFYECEYRVPRPNSPDGFLWLAQRAIIVRRDKETGAPLRLLGVTQDVTERRALQANLEQLVEDRTAALRETEGRLAQASKMEALGRLAGGVAHDFNNVLQAVQGGLALASKRITKNPEAALGYLNLATDATKRGAAVTSRLLAFARRSELDSTVVDPEALLGGLAQMLRHTMGPTIRLALSVGSSCPAVMADLGQLESVLVNLANNARDALPDGRGTISLEATGHGSPPAHLPPGRYVRLSVTDNGAGMPPEVLARVTEPFFTTKSKGKGTGLGLAMARGFAEQSGGALEIESASGKGTTVSLWLPEPDDATLQRAEAAASTPSQQPVPAKQVRLLVVDDDPCVRTVTAATLAERGHEVAQAAGGAAALSMIDQGLPLDALVTDFAMPGDLDGLTLIQEVRRRHPNLPAVLVTGHVGDARHSALEEAAGNGPFAVLHKPASAEAVEAQLFSLLHLVRQATDCS